DAGELIADRLVDLGDAMAEEVAPEGRGRVEEAAPLVVDEVVAFRAHDHQRIVGRILGHLGERVPEVGGIPGPDVFRESRHGRLRPAVTLRPAPTAGRWRRRSGPGEGARSRGRNAGGPRR